MVFVSRALLLFMATSALAQPSSVSVFHRGNRDELQVLQNSENSIQVQTPTPPDTAEILQGLLKNLSDDIEWDLDLKQGLAKVKMANIELAKEIMSKLRQMKFKCGSYQADGYSHIVLYFSEYRLEDVIKKFFQQLSKF